MTSVKFSDISRDSWSELQPYLDTCMIPYTGLTGEESPIEATALLERLRDFMDIVEMRYKGRIVTYPAFHYENQENYEILNDICLKIKNNGFKYVMIMTADTSLEQSQCDNCDLILSQQQLEQLLGNDERTLSSIIQEKIENLWKVNNLHQM